MKQEWYDKKKEIFRVPNDIEILHAAMVGVAFSMIFLFLVMLYILFFGL